MPERRLSELCAELSAGGLAASFEGDDCLIRSVNTLDAAKQGEITFLSNPKYANAVFETMASAVIARRGIELPSRLSAIRCDDPYGAVTLAIAAIHGHRKHPQWGVSARATIHTSSRIGANANIAAGVTLEADVCVGDRCTFYPGCYVGEGVTIGHDCVFYPNVVVYDGCRLGDRVTIHAGSVIGQDGLGYAPRGRNWVKIPQVGRVIIGDDVEIGANCAIDRATLGKTEIGAGTKLGNVIVIGHGTRVGANCLFVGLVGVAGSVTIGDHVTLAGQVGVAGHLSVGDNVSVGAQAGVTNNVPPDSKLLGSPARPLEDARRSFVLIDKLPDLQKRIKELEQNVELLTTMLKDRL